MQQGSSNRVAQPQALLDLPLRHPDAGPYEGTNNASILTEPAPTGPYVVETRVTVNVPPAGCCYNHVQAGLMIHGGDDNFIKLAGVSP